MVAYGRATVRHCVVVGNRAPRGGGFSADGDNYTAGPLRAEFCTFSGNRAAWGGAGAAEELGTLSLSHCILWGDEADEGPELAASYLDYKGRLAVAFCNLQGGQAGVSTPHPPSAWWGPGNMEACPCFASPGYWDANSTPDDQSDDFWVDGDYHLMSQAGRWLADEGRWTTDEVTSPCIDAGDPSRPVGSEPEPNGGRVNLGAYGGTDEASKSPPHTPWAADLNRDGTVDGADIAVISRNWLAESICTCIPGDVDGDGVVDFRDMAMVAADWLMQ
ncbi:MAG TPA: hypothetical protein ENN81_02770 [Phycisphaerales bacterium]|nr:hypothetical protein [Phycisphaerales bacterium]